MKGCYFSGCTKREDHFGPCTPQIGESKVPAGGITAVLGQADGDHDYNMELSRPVFREFAESRGIAAPNMDKCEFCRGTKGGTPGNENIVDGVTMCDYCTVTYGRATAIRNNSPKPIVTVGDVEAIEEEVGMGAGAWDMVKPEEIIIAVLKHYAKHQGSR